MITSAHIIGGRFLGGAELFYARLVTALHRRGYPTLAVTVPNSLITAEIPLDVPRLHIPMRGVWDFWARWQIGRAIRQHGPDIVQTYMGRATRLTHLASGQRTIHIARIGGYYNPHGYRHADAWIVISPGLRDHLIRYGFPENRIFCISNFIAYCGPSSAIQLQNLRQKIGVPEDALILTAVGRLHPVKGFDHLLKAFAMLPKQIGGRPVYLIVVGDGPSAAHLKNYAEALGVNQRIRWTGWRKDPGRFQELADLCVCSSRQEGLGSVILEAWAHNRAVISTRAQGPLDLMIDGENGWLVPIGDYSAMATAMECLLRDESLRRELAEQGHRTVVARHGEDAIVQAYLNLYQSLLQT